MAIDIGRRQFISALGGAVATWPLVARAQQGERMPQIGVLTNFASDDAVSQARMTAFIQALQQLGWTDGRNVRIEVRWGADDADRFSNYAVELVALSPDVILTSTTTAAALLLLATRTVPIVIHTDAHGFKVAAIHEPRSELVIRLASIRRNVPAKVDVLVLAFDRNTLAKIAVCYSSADYLGHHARLGICKNHRNLLLCS